MRIRPPPTTRRMVRRSTAAPRGAWATPSRGSPSCCSSLRSSRSSLAASSSDFTRLSPWIAKTLLGLDRPVVSGLLLALPLLLWPLTAATVALLRSSSGAGREAGPGDPDTYEVAILSKGPEFATNAAIASLVQRGLLSLDASDRRLALQGDRAIDLHPLEDAIRTAIDPESGSGLKEVRSTARPFVEQLRNGLVDRGLMVPECWAAWLGWTGIMLVVVCFPSCCAAGVWTGCFLGGLVSFLVLIAAVHHLFLDVGRTIDGDRVLDDVKHQYTFDEIEFPEEDEHLALRLAFLDRDALPEGGLAELWDILDPSNPGGDADASDDADDGGINGGD